MHAWLDDEHRYGLATRLLHWLMAIAFAWQFTGMAIKLIVGRAPITAFWVGTHASVGMILMLLILIRAGWALSQRSARPPHERTIVGRAAKAGHGLLYLLMFVVPALALLRQWGGGRDTNLFGWRIAAGTGEKIEWLIAPANALHMPLAWLLLAMIGGHVAMVVIHRFVWRDDVAHRMLGRLNG